jgi:glycosyltransferase involved in cell wall biosynthesis
MIAQPSLRCLFLHNYYQHAGGEDISMAAEIAILRQAGHQVELMQWHNDAIKTMSRREKLNLFWQTIWNPDSKQQVRQALKDLNADLLHVQNFFPLISPSVYSAAKSLDIPVVQHLRNFRLGCLNVYLYRNGQVCEACVGRNPWRGVLYRCYRDSLPASLGVWQMVTAHRLRRTWHREVDAFITPSQFAADKLIEIGLPAEKLHVKPNFLSDPLVDGQIPPLPEIPTFVFIGRLSPEKGVLQLLRAWAALHQPDWQLWIVGDGPQRPELEQLCQDQQLQNVTFWGYCSPASMLEILQKSSLLVMPSRWYETFGRVVVEAFACGRAAVVSDLGAIAELVTDGTTGFKVNYAEPAVWVETLRWCGEHPQKLAQMGHHARQVYQEHYTSEVNYRRLIEIYARALN